MSKVAENHTSNAEHTLETEDNASHKETKLNKLGNGVKNSAGAEIISNYKEKQMFGLRNRANNSVVDHLISVITGTISLFVTSGKKNGTLNKNGTSDHNDYGAHEKNGIAGKNGGSETNGHSVNGAMPAVNGHSQNGHHNIDEHNNNGRQPLGKFVLEPFVKKDKIDVTSDKEGQIMKALLEIDFNQEYPDEIIADRISTLEMFRDTNFENPERYKGGHKWLFDEFIKLNEVKQDEVIQKLNEKLMLHF
jgi:hypothetical protein